MTKQEHEKKMLELYDEAVKDSNLDVAFQVMAVLSQGLTEDGPKLV
jgi:hypothetical protein